MEQKQLESEKEKYIHSDFHEKVLYERYSNMQQLPAAIARGDAKLAYQLYHAFLQSTAVINERYTPQAETIRVIRNQLVSLNTLCMVFSFQSNPNPLYFHTVSRHYDTMIETISSREQADALIREMLNDYCAFSALSDGKTYSESIRKAIWHITADPARKLCLDELAKTLGMSASALSRKFHAETGQTLSQYQTAFRIRTAQRCLRENQDSITQIAYQVGYTDASYFSKVFTKHTGVSPSEYTRQFLIDAKRART